MNFETIMNRVKETTPIKNMVQLAAFVGCTQQNVSARKTKNTFPEEWAFKIAQKYNLSTDWIMTGTGPMRPGDPDEDNETISEIKRWLSDLEKDNPKAKDWFDYDFQQRYPEFKEWQKKRKSQDSEPSIPQRKTA